MKTRLKILGLIALGVVLGLALPYVKVERAEAAPVVGDIADEQLDTYIQQTLRPLCERIRADKIKVNAAIARYALLAAPPNTAAVVSQRDSDRSFYPTITGANVNDVQYSLGLIKNLLDSIPDVNFERFCVRSVEVAQ